MNMMMGAMGGMGDMDPPGSIRLTPNSSPCGCCCGGSAAAWNFGVPLTYGAVALRASVVWHSAAIASTTVTEQSTHPAHGLPSLPHMAVAGRFVVVCLKGCGGLTLRCICCRNELKSVGFTDQHMEGLVGELNEVSAPTLLCRRNLGS